MVDDFLSQHHSSYLENQDDDFYTEDVEYTDDDWQWEERLRLINEFSNWTSGDDGLDRFLQQTQLETPDPRYHMKWIPFDSFSDIKFVAKGGHSSVFSATWLNETERVWDGARQAFIEKPLIVALKSLKNSQQLSEEFLDEFKRHGSLKLDGCGYVVHCHGVTRNPETQEYMMVMNYAEDGDLRHYIQKNLSTLRWKDVVEMLCSIAMGLLNVHKNDFGLCGPSNPSEPRGVYGSLPFIAPEVLAGGLFSAKADIYSFAFIMWELSSGRPPFSDRPHDHSLALEICHGFREAVVPGTPLFYEQLMVKCWNADPSLRPDAEEIVDILLSPYGYQRRILGLDEFVINTANDIDDVDQFEQTLASRISNTNYPVSPDVHPFAFYNSRFILFPNLPTPQNSFVATDQPIMKSYLDFNDKSQQCSLQYDDEMAYEEYDTNYPPEFSDIESDNESENEQYIPPPPPISMLRRKSLAPIPLAIN